MEQTQYKKSLLELPAETAAALVEARRSGNRELLLSYIAALRVEGWTYESIAAPLGVTRERVRQLWIEAQTAEGGSRLSLYLAEAARAGFSVPTRPLVERAVVAKRVRPEPDAAALARLLELKPLAERVRANSSAYRAEAEEYVALLYSEHVGRGVSMWRLAKELGVTHAAIRSRLVRYGYLETGSAAKAYTPIRSDNRV